MKKNKMLEAQRSYRMGSMGAPMVNRMQAPYGPADFAVDAAWKFIGQPIYNIASGNLMQAVSAPRDEVPMDDSPNAMLRAQELNRSNAAGALGAGMEAGGMAALGSFGGGAVAPKIVAKYAQQNPPEKVYHYGTAPVGGRFEPPRSGYSGDVFVSPSSKMAANSANHKGSMHELSLDPSVKVFDYEDPAHVNAAMDWWKSRFGGSKSQIENAEEIARRELEEGIFHRMEPSKYPSSHTVNPFIRDNFDAYYVKEYGGHDTKNIGIHRPNSLFNPDGSTFYGNPFSAAVVPSYAAPRRDDRR